MYQPAATEALHQNAIPRLVRIISSDNSSAHEHASYALGNIVCCREAEITAVAAGAIVPLVKLLASDRIDVLRAVCHALAYICYSNDGARAKALDASVIVRNTTRSGIL